MEGEPCQHLAKRCSGIFHLRKERKKRLTSDPEGGGVIITEAEAN